MLKFVLPLFIALGIIIAEILIAFESAALVSANDDLSVIGGVFLALAGIIGTIWGLTKVGRKISKLANQ